MLTGHWAAGHRGRSQRVGRQLRVRSCDRLTAGGRPPMISHIPAAARRSDPTMKEREHDRQDQEIGENNGGAKYNEPGGRGGWGGGIRVAAERGGERIKVIDVSRDRKSCLWSSGFTRIALLATRPLIVTWRKVSQHHRDDQGGKKRNEDGVKPRSCASCCTKKPYSRCMSVAIVPFQSHHHSRQHLVSA